MLVTLAEHVGLSGFSLILSLHHVGIQIILRSDIFVTFETFLDLLIVLHKSVRLVIVTQTLHYLDDFQVLVEQSFL